jgi:transglutaminase-like putative cysteine protease
MDLSAWFEVYLGDHWYTFDARRNTPRIGRVLMARGRDATDVAISTSFGPCALAGFKVVTEQVPAEAPSANADGMSGESHHHSGTEAAA